MNFALKLICNILLITALVVFISILQFGWTDFTNALGGVMSFAGLIAFLAMGAVIIGGILFLQDQDYTNRMTARLIHLVVATIVVVILAIVGFQWVDLPSGAGMKVLVSLVSILVVSFASTWLGYVEDE